MHSHTFGEADTALALAITTALVDTVVAAFDFRDRRSGCHRTHALTSDKQLLWHLQ